MKKIIQLYYACLLGFTTYTGFGLTNEDSRATSIFTVVFLFTIGGILNLFGLKVLDLPVILNILVVLLSFLVFYRYFKNGTTKDSMDKTHKSLKGKDKVILTLSAVAYTILSVIFFIKTV